MPAMSPSSTSIISARTWAGSADSATYMAASSQGPLAFGPLSAKPLDPDLTAGWMEPLSGRAVRRDLAKFARQVHPRVLVHAASTFGQFTGPVRIVWGEGDPFFTTGRHAGEHRGVPLVRPALAMCCPAA